MAASKVMIMLSLVAAVVAGTIKSEPSQQGAAMRSEPETQMGSMKPHDNAAHVEQVSMRSEPLPAAETAAQIGAAKPHVAAAVKAEEKKAEPSVRAGKQSNVVSMAVEADGDVKRMQHSEAAGKKADEKPHVVLASEPSQAPSETQQEQAPVQKEASWKGTFFFVGSLVLMGVLGSMIAARVYAYTQSKATETSAAEKVSLKAKESSASAAALQQHLNDSSSTSDSGEKIAMLFDRVRKSLEDLSTEKVDSEQADVAGQGPKASSATNTL